jgi:hypothetical protein
LRISHLVLPDILRSSSSGILGWLFISYNRIYHFLLLFQLESYSKNNMSIFSNLPMVSWSNFKFLFLTLRSMIHFDKWIHFDTFLVKCIWIYYSTCPLTPFVYCFFLSACCISVTCLHVCCFVLLLIESKLLETKIHFVYFLFISLVSKIVSDT